MGEFPTETPDQRTLPVVILADCSYSMAADGKMDSLNSAMRDMIRSFLEPMDRNALVKVMVIRFCDEMAEVHTLLQQASSVVWDDLEPSGATPMGKAFGVLKDQLEKKDVFTSADYRPVIILASDGQPTDEWEAALEALNDSERAMKADRFALAIGTDADVEVLKKFVSKAKENTESQYQILRANEAGEIKKAFKAMTMSVQRRTASRNDKPDMPPVDMGLEAIDA